MIDDEREGARHHMSIIAEICKLIIGNLLFCLQFVKLLSKDKPSTKFSQREQLNILFEVLMRVNDHEDNPTRSVTSTLQRLGQAICLCNDQTTDNRQTIKLDVCGCVQMMECAQPLLVDGAGKINAAWGINLYWHCMACPGWLHTVYFPVTTSMQNTQHTQTNSNLQTSKRTGR